MKWGGYFRSEMELQHTCSGSFIPSHYQDSSSAWISCTSLCCKLLPLALHPKQLSILLLTSACKHSLLFLSIRYFAFFCSTCQLQDVLFYLFETKCYSWTFLLCVLIYKPEHSVVIAFVKIINTFFPTLSLSCWYMFFLCRTCFIPSFMPPWGRVFLSFRFLIFFLLFSHLV